MVTIIKVSPRFIDVFVFVSSLLHTREPHFGLARTVRLLSFVLIPISIVIVLCTREGGGGPGVTLMSGIVQSLGLFECGHAYASHGDRVGVLGPCDGGFLPSKPEQA
ncbi:hypothetical protein BKA82DRAFT_865378 [Pisolithus tinctorius]|uniref:Uncharacterized protein n=1 Tax=Pisolithus tinctorius Marx 270 TaxID=870435 RepID=A0A0C3NRT7_PISTI|nr:hypothetical protein BKA82DRAFT_865378 [Pisolithus tinctorius]KIN98003.1 hypothetical protein M404DRAFT_865378 [Pisolithus tinctorius Marx 270]